MQGGSWTSGILQVGSIELSTYKQYGAISPTVRIHWSKYQGVETGVVLLSLVTYLAKFSLLSSRHYALMA